MKILVHERLEVGDIVLTTTNEPISFAIRLATKGDISHAMLYVDTCSVIDATNEGVQARNTQRILIEDDRAVHVLRLKAGLSAKDAISICDFARSRVGTQYSVKEAIRVAAGGSDVWSRKQFCSRLVAQAYSSVGIDLVLDANFCSPNDILRSDQLTEIQDITRPATKEDLQFSEVTDIPQRMRDTTNAFLAGVRVKVPEIQHLNDVFSHLQSNPADDDHFHKALMDSGYLTVWQMETDESPWHFDLALMEAIPDSRSVQTYCVTILGDAGQARRRHAINASQSERPFKEHPLKTFGAFRDLSALLLDLLHARRYVAAMWLARHAPNALPPVVHTPHTPEWFAEYEIEEPDKAAMTKAVLNNEGREDICSICGDEPAADYRRAGPILPGILTPTLRLCDDCLTIRKQHHSELYVPFST